MILIALGSNLSGSFGNPENTLRAAIQSIGREGIEVIKVSRIWITEPVPASEQPLYRNAVIQVKTDLSAEGLLNTLQGIETDFGRIRHERNEARVIDLDVLAYNDAVIFNVNITVPHPRMHERAFVLVPLNEIVPSWKHPVLQKTASEMLNLLLDPSQITSMREVA